MGKVLTDSQIESYRLDGFLFIESAVSDEWMDRLRATTAEFLDSSRAVTRSNRMFDLEPDHSSASPRLRRLNSPADFHDAYWDFARESVITDIAEDLLGPNLKYHHGKLNFKADSGGTEVRWHQDIQFWPHTNYDPLTIGVFLDDVSDDMGCVGFLPGSHDSALFDLYDGDRWVGHLSDDDIDSLPLEHAVFPTGPAGSVTVHNCRTVHGSAPNNSDKTRPLLLQTYSPADAFTYSDLVRATEHGDELIRGVPAQWARHDPRPCQVGPSEYRTIFQVQQQ